MTVTSGAPTALWRLSRPRLLPFVLGLVVLGWAWAHWDRALTVRGGGALGIALLAWSALNAGTLWLNAVLDRDEGPVLLGEAVRPPPHTTRWAYAALAAALGLAFWAGPVVGGCMVGCVVLAVLYSHPATQWKGHPVGGPLVNVLGYAGFSPAAGFAVAGVGPDARTLVVWPLVAVGILGTYYAAQAFQGEEDRARGYRTLVATHGPRVVLQVVRSCFLVAMVGGAALAAVGWLPRPLLLAVGAWLPVDRYLAGWAAAPGGGTEAQARGFARRLGWVLALAIVLAFVPYVVDSFLDRPVAGLGTAAGHPPDRPRLSPAAMRQWERSE
jgi:4-hydroxybenzoate polyprenyltransferase